MAQNLLMTAEVIQKAIKKLKEKNYSHVQECGKRFMNILRMPQADARM